jgi:glucan phosphoethanolaminetransferase (alkaline phosphatase superfamily)
LAQFLDCSIDSIEGVAMKKSVYFILQIAWSLVVSALTWYFTLINASFDFYGNSDNTLSGMIFVIGAAIYVILTLAHIVIGAVKVKEWRWWFILISLVIAVAIAFAGLYLVVYGTEFLNRTFGLTFNS